MIVPFALLLAVTASAQSNDVVDDGLSRKQFSFGPVVSYGHSWISPYGNSVFMPSMSVGVFGIYSPIEHFGIGMDVRYSQEGSKVDNAEGGTTTTRIDYVRIPVRAMWFAGELGDDFRPKVTLGPSFGFKTKYDGPSVYNPNGFDIGLLGSAGFNYRVARATWLNFDVGYYQGITEVLPQSARAERNGNVSVNLGVGFDI